MLATPLGVCLLAVTSVALAVDPSSGAFNRTAYLSQQGAKIDLLREKHILSAFDRHTERDVRTFYQRNGLSKLKLNLRGRNMLCVGARAGGEVRAFQSLGAFAVGIDLFPGNASLVLQGDAMNIQFATRTVDVVFSNVADHIPFLDKFFEEVVRVLRPRGVFLLDVAAQTVAVDRWAVRDTGDKKFYAETDAQLTRLGLVRGPRVSRNVAGVWWTTTRWDNKL